MRLITALSVAFMLAAIPPAHAKKIDPANGGQGEFSKLAVRAIIGEASGECRRKDESCKGMQAVAEVIRRRGSLKGFYGLKSPHVDREPAWVWEMARKAWRASKTSNLTAGATHFEGVGFKTPYWAKGRQPVAVIGRQAFYKI